MDSIPGKTIKNNLQMIDIKPMIAKIKNYPNDTTEMSKIIKYLTNLPTIHYTINENSEYLKKTKSIYELTEEPKIRNTISGKNELEPNRLTINNNTNLTNFNLYVLYNTDNNESLKNSTGFRNSKSVKKKEPTDTINKKKYLEYRPKKNNKNLDDKNKTQRTQKYYSIRYSMNKIKSKSPKNNPHFLSSLKKDGTKKRSEKVDENLEQHFETLKITEKEKEIINYTKNKSQNKIIKEEEPRSELNLSEFVRLNQLGKGTFGIIFAVKWNKNGKKYALKKEVFTDPEFFQKRKSIMRIINDFLLKTKSEGVIKIYSSLCLKNKKEYNYYELMELGERDWEQEIIIRRKKGLYYTEKEIFNITKQLIKTLALMQKNHITHRDIKHQNILIVNGNYKLCDFGEIRMMKGNGLVVQRIRGSELFMSPILFYGLRANLIQVKHNTYKSDVFSLGMCLLYAATMHFDGTDEIREMIDMKMIKLSLEKYLKERYSNKFINLLCIMLETNEDLRPDFEQLEKKIDNLLIV